MLQKLGDHVQACDERATACAEEAKATINENLRADVLRMEASWMKLARSYEFV
jgi:hypothetical protein